MDQRKLKLFKGKLGAKKDEILAAYEKNKNYGMEANGEGAQDLVDRAASSYTKEFLFSLSSTERDTLQLVDEAISRIEEKLFGVCVACEGEMEKKRLEAVPWAKHCLTCQEMQEQGLL